MNQLPALPACGTAPSEVRMGIFNRIVLLVKYIRQSAVYNDTMGQDLGIIPAARGKDTADWQPQLRLQLENGYPVLRWRREQSHSLHLYVDRRDGNGFVLLKRTIKTAYTDREALPPDNTGLTWDYKARFLFYDEEVGRFSAVLSVALGRPA